MNQRLKRELPLHLMMIAPLVVIFIFSYVPMAGIVIAFQRFIPARGLFGDQRWVGFDNFTYVFQPRLSDTAGGWVIGTVE